MLPLLLSRNWANDPSGYLYNPGYRTVSWQNTCQPYTKNWQMMVCPDSGLTKTDPVTTLDPFSNYAMTADSRASAGAPTIWADYWYTPVATAWNGLGGLFSDNGITFASYPTAAGRNSATLAEVAAPASMTLIHEGANPESWCDYYGSSYPYPTGLRVSWSGSPYVADYNLPREAGPIGNHLITGSGSYGSKWAYQWEPTVTGGFMNVGFLDGHTKSFPLKQYWQPKITSTGQRVMTYLWPPE
jgi:prepilin-type processing-associated H-X9-DG protein